MKNEKMLIFTYLKAFVLLIAFSCSITIFGQTVNVKGTVTDVSGEPLIGVNVLEENTSNGTVTDLSGSFTLEVSSSQSILVFSYIGYEVQSVLVGNNTTLNIVLEEDARSLDELIVVGYGTQYRREISGSITSVSERNFNKGVTNTGVDLLKGKVAGLNITQGSGDISKGQTVRLRGTSSLTGSSQPFVVIDGVPGMDLNSVFLEWI